MDDKAEPVFLIVQEPSLRVSGFEGSPPPLQSVQILPHIRYKTTDRLEVAGQGNRRTDAHEPTNNGSELGANSLVD